MASGGGMGRGTGRGLAFLDKLKQKSEVPKEESPAESSVDEAIAAEVRRPLQSAAASQEKPKLPFGRGGFIASVLETRERKTSISVDPQFEEVRERSRERKKSETTTAAEPVRRLPSIGRTGERRISEAEQQSPVAPRLPGGRGAGFLRTSITPAAAGVGIKTASAEVAPPPAMSAIKRLSPTKSTTSETAPTVQKIVEKEKEIEPVKPVERVKTSSATKTSEGSTGKSQMASDISHKTMERAMEELKVEELKPVAAVQKVGESGTPASLSANYIKLRCKNSGVYQYMVNFDPPVDSLACRKRMISGLRDIIGHVRLFDGMILFLPIMLPEQTTIAKAKRPTDDEETTMTIRLTKILPPEDVPPVVFNIIIRNIMNELKMKQIGQHYYNPKQYIRIPNHNLDIWPGYTTSVRNFEDGLYLVADVAHKVIRQETCISILGKLFQKHSNDAVFKQEALNALVGTTVLTPYNNRTYRIDDILWDLNPLSEFVYHNGEKTNYVKYYESQYGIKIDDPSQPLLLHRSQKKKAVSPTQAQPEMICLIPELCNLTGLTEEIRKDFRIMKDLAVHTRVTPQQRYESLKMFIETIKATPNAIRQIESWGLEMADNTVEFTGRLMPEEKITMGRNECFMSGPQCDWNNDVGRKHMLTSVNLQNWIIVYPRISAKIAERFAEQMYQCSKQMGIFISEPVPIEISDDRAENFVREIKNHMNEHIQLVCIIFARSRDDYYAAVKRLCCIDYPVPSQVIIAKTITEEKKLRSVTQKIILQMNCKLGGELWRLDMPVKKLMVVGIDVYHQTVKKFKSLAGFVSTLNSECTRYYSKVCFQMTGQELIDSMKIAFTQSLKKYQEVNGYLPDRIIIFRDGVSDGQFKHVGEHEVEQLKSVFQADYSPKMAFVIVQKRINARFFQSTDRRRQYKNPEPGTIVDHDLTSKEYYDFFLVSQHVRQGTVTPTHYVVISDDTQLKVDHMQRVSYKLTHLYYNWPGTIRVPAPCQYAHKLAFLTGQYLQKDPDPLLCNRLFYL